MPFTPLFSDTNPTPTVPTSSFQPLFSGNNVSSKANLPTNKPGLLQKAGSVIGKVASAIPGPIGDVANVAKIAANAPAQIGDAFNSGIDQIKQGFSDAKLGNSPVQATEGALKIGAGAINTLSAPLAPVFAPVSEGVNFLADKISNLPGVQKFAASPAGKVTSKIAEDVGNASTIAGAVAGTAEKGPTVVEKVANLPKPSDISQSLQDKFVKQETSDWQRPVNTPSPSYNKASEIFNNAQNKGHSIPDTLVQNKIKLSNNIENGKYSTEDTAAKIRTDAGKASSDLLRPSLQMADHTTPKTSVNDITNSTISDIKNTKGITPGDMETQIAKAKSEGVSLQNKYPDGMSLTNMHDEKINYALNGKYSPIGDTNVNNTSGVNRAFGRTLAKTVETKAPSDVPVKEFNNELSKQYQAADYLDALNNKKVPTSILSKVAKTTAKVVGAALGESLGGGVLGGVGGYHIGGMLEGLIENMANPIKGAFLDNLSKTNPEAFNAIKGYLGNEKTAALTRKALPYPSEIGTSKNPIITPAPTTYEPAATKIYTEPAKTQLQLPAPVQRQEPIVLPGKGILEGQQKLRQANIPYSKNFDQIPSVAKPITKISIKANIPRR